MSNFSSSYGNVIEAQARTGQMFTLALIAILIIIVITVRIIVGYFIARRGNMIIEAKGYFPSDYSVNGMACYLSLFSKKLR